MEVQGKVIQVLPTLHGISKNSGKEWEVQPFVIETEGQYPRKIYFEIFGSERVAQNTPAEGSTVNVSFDLESIEFNGHWYTKPRAWRVVSTAEKAQEQEQVQEQVQQEGEGDLPF